MKIPLPLMCDSYKHTHHYQTPPGTKYISSYIESRGTDMPWSEHVFFGLQGFIKEYLLTPITHADVDIAVAFNADHLGPGILNEAGWRYIVDTHKGYLPVRIQAVPEGTVLPLKNVLVQIVNTDPECPWLTSLLETALHRAIWYPTTVATLSREVKKKIATYLLETNGSLDGIDFMLHDFGARGVSTSESAQIGGASHLVNFKGTDTQEAIYWLMEYYNTTSMPAHSVPASEHSTITSWGKDGEAAAYKNMIQKSAKPNGIISIVSDSWDIWNAVDNIFGDELKPYVTALQHIGAKLVIRPDSGDPTTVPIKVIEKLCARFQGHENEQGYMVLPPYLGVLQGDGINFDSITVILENMKKAGLAISNIVFGMGGGLLQKVDRDTLKFAMKCSASKGDDEWFDVYKDPVTDPGKKSKRGRLSLIERDGYWETVREGSVNPAENRLVTVFENGKLLVDDTLDNIRERAAIK